MNDELQLVGHYLKTAVRLYYRETTAPALSCPSLGMTQFSKPKMVSRAYTGVVGQAVDE